MTSDFEVFHRRVCAAVLAAVASCPLVCPCRAEAGRLQSAELLMTICTWMLPAVVVPVRVGADNGLVSGEMLVAKFLAQRLRLINGQTVVRSVPWVKADDIVVAFHIFPFLVLPIAEIGAHTGNSKILVAAVQRGKAVVLTGNKPPVFIKGGLHGKLVMFKGEVLLRLRHSPHF